MARYQLIFAYDGTHFLGYQRQGAQRTVQLELEKALRELGWTDRAVQSAGRTDTGVHASGQVAAFDLEWQHAEQDLLRALNAHLPEDIAVRQVKVVSGTFHPRFDAISRSYRYRIYLSPVRDPLRDRFTWRVWPDVDLELVREAAKKLVGEHDFRAFGSPTSPKGSTVRNVMRANWDREGDELTFSITANAFLYRMVRRLTFTQVLVGQGADSLEQFGRAVEFGEPLNPGLAEPQGLVLEEVCYPPSSKDSGTE